ncbi:MAG: hypothetical protein APR53_10625 [Methanoculleus sp. SDB]|nr:MAG: hypothetical protein APR53_10625 [Methanoculleus sp. SDB]
MRRIYHRFPPSCDLNFDIDRSFSDLVRCIQKLHHSHITNRKGADLVKLTFLVDVADKKTQFVPVDYVSDIAETVTEACDFRITLHETMLTPEKSIPVSENMFLVRVNDAGQRCDCFAVKEGRQGQMDAMDLRELLKGACE